MDLPAQPRRIQIRLRHHEVCYQLLFPQLHCEESVSDSFRTLCASRQGSLELCYQTCPTCRTQSEATGRASTPSSGHSLPRLQLPIRPCSTPGLSTVTTTSCLAPPVPAQLPHCHSGPGSAVSVKLIQTMRHLPARARSGSSFPHGYRIPFQQQQLQLSQSAVPPTPGPTAQGQPPTHSPYSHLQGLQAGFLYNYFATKTDDLHGGKLLIPLTSELQLEAASQLHKLAALLMHN